MTSFRPHVDILPPTQKDLLPKLQWTVAAGFVLYGGTAIALRCGHRSSVDFDFFTDQPLDREFVFYSLRNASVQLETLQDERQSLTVITSASEVKLSFFGNLLFGRVSTPARTLDGFLAVASTLDLLATKLKVVMQRAEARDYLDIASLLREGVPLERGLGAARSIYGEAFSASECLRALTFFQDGDLETLAPDVRAALRAAVGAASLAYPTPTVPILSKTLSEIDSPKTERGALEL